MCPTSLSRTSLAPFNIAAERTSVGFRSGQGYLVAGNNYSRRPQINVTRNLRGNETFEQREVASVGVECIWPQHQPDRGSMSIVRRNGLRLKNAAQGAIGHQQPERIDARV